MQVKGIKPEYFDSIKNIIRNVSRVIKGKNEEVNLVFCALLSEGHILIEDLPGTGKTTLARAVARSFNIGFTRIQFTSDLLPSDIIGVSVFNSSKNSFEFKKGPIFSNIVLADEINRATPKAQSALLEAMSERQVTVDGITYSLERPFLVIATQNPYEHYGTFPLPESQLDRFALWLSLGYPSREKEIEIFDEEPSEKIEELVEVVMGKEELREIINAVKNVYVDKKILSFIMDIVEGTRTSRKFVTGVSPRAGIFIKRASQAFAFLKGRDYVVIDDVKRIAPHVLKHRLIPRNASPDPFQVFYLVSEYVENVKTGF